jgi:ParB-like chromosome segregation protein Spo0J
METLKPLIKYLKDLPRDERIKALNRVKLALHAVSPFKNEPVDCVLWIENGKVDANDYNPNSVAPPEMKLLEISIDSDGYTQPIVTFKEGDSYTTVDGFHRGRVGKESPIVLKRVMGYLPVTCIRSDREDRSDRIASTIRHNRARGKHQISAMSDIVVELKRRNWSNEKVGRELGMDPDEVLRLSQISGLAEMFSDKEFSQSWESGQINEEDNLETTEEFTGEDAEGGLEE